MTNRAKSKSNGRNATERKIHRCVLKAAHALDAAVAADPHRSLDPVVAGWRASVDATALAWATNPSTLATVTGFTVTACRQASAAEHEALAAFGVSGGVLPDPTSDKWQIALDAFAELIRTAHPQTADTILRAIAQTRFVAQETSHDVTVNGAAHRSFH